MGHSHRIKWTDEDIKREVKKVITAGNLDRMPSNKECINFFGNYALSNAVSKRYGGWYALAKEMGYPVKKSETYLGKAQEQETCDMLTSMGFDVARMSTRFPYDILVDNCVKIDVKASHLYQGKNGNFYTFNLEKKYATCDIYVLNTLDDEGNIVDSFVVPSKFVMNNTQISIGEVNSKYSVFKDRWDYISNISEFFRSIT